MTKTSLEVIARAHREIRVLSVDEEPSADQIAYGGEVLDGILSAAQTQHGLSFTWDKETVPDGVYQGLAFCLAAHLAPHYGEAYERRSWGWGQLKAAMNPSNLADSRDLDDDGTVSDAEKDAGLRALYY